MLLTLRPSLCARHRYSFKSRRRTSNFRLHKSVATISVVVTLYVSDFTLSYFLFVMILCFIINAYIYNQIVVVDTYNIAFNSQIAAVNRTIIVVYTYFAIISTIIVAVAMTPVEVTV